jgi:hypothetical protein
MRKTIMAMVALGGLGAMTLGTPTPASAQVYFDAPGFSVGVGRPWYRHHYYDPYAYGYAARPYWWHRHHYRWRDWD